jgi:hypothetical protein
MNCYCCDSPAEYQEIEGKQRPVCPRCIVEMYKEIIKDEHEQEDLYDEENDYYPEYPSELPKLWS